MDSEKLFDNRSLIIEIFVCFVCVLTIYILSGRFDLLEMAYEASRDLEDWELDEFIATAGLSCLVILGFAVRRWIVNRKLRKELAEQYAALKTAQEEIRALKGIVPICSACKKIRDDKGFWQQVETYIEDHSDAVFSHSMCPSCLTEYYGNEPWFDKKEKDK